MNRKKRTVRIGTRGSKLALWQADRAREMVMEALPGAEVEIVEVRTDGDDDQHSSLTEMGGVGVFVKKLEAELLANNIDVAVHSAKDMPAKLAEGLLIAAVPPRGVVNDALVCREHLGLDDLPRGALIGTSSPRRAAQLARLRPDFVIHDIRGNVDTRLRKVDDGDYEATMLSWAGLRRMGLAWRIDDVFDLTNMLPAPGQGIVALQVRDDDKDFVDALAAVGHASTLERLRVEREFTKILNAGCHAAVAGLARHYGQEGIRFVGRVLTLDGETMLEEERSSHPGESPESLGKRVAEALLDEGAGEIIEEQLP